MIVKQIYTGSMFRNFSYLIEAEKGFYCIDPYDGKQVLDIIDSLDSKLVAIINTHEHWDHTKGNNYLIERTNCLVYAHEMAKGKIEGVTQFLSKGDELYLGNERVLETLDTPGHTFSHLCLYLKDNDLGKAVFTGDTLFNAGVGNTKNGGDPEILFETIENIFGSLGDEIKVYPGHEYLGNNLKFALTREPGNQKAKELLQFWEEIDWDVDEFQTTMGIEREINPFLRLENSEIRSHLTGNPFQNKEVFLKLRSLRDKW